MQNERQRILQLVENGTISAEEAIMLLEALGKDKPTESVMPLTPQAEEPREEPKQTSQNFGSAGADQQKKTTGFEDLFGKAFNDKEMNKKMNEFMHDLKEDLSQFSNRMANLMNTTFSKVKDFDFQFPFGEKVEFEKTYAFNAEEVNGFEVDVPNGKLTIEKSEDSQVLVETQVKVPRNADNNEEETIARFTDGFVTLQEGKVTVATNVKMAAVSVRLLVPEKQYDVFITRVLNGSVTISNIDTKLLKVKTYNGTIKVEHATFNSANLESGNGMIEARFVKGEDLEAETVNGRIYIDGSLKEVEAESVNGPVTITNSSEAAHKVKATTVAGTVELYVPKTVSIDGQVATNFGKTDVGLQDVTMRTEEDQFLLKTMHFDKILENAPVLKLVGETRTGSVIVRYINNL
ncbi:DUF4097 family beta strand repeat-containing protein [Solibacillus sp. CAU 1738]|uniref:SHOCT-like domain-containing protein n=1 Tax=Solibacillus sp. CAU 1738 TaxID=3140363 RepID=UPI003260ACBD